MQSKQIQRSQYIKEIKRQSLNALSPTHTISYHTFNEEALTVFPGNSEAAARISPQDIAERTANPAGAAF